MKTQWRFWVSILLSLGAIVLVSVTIFLFYPDPFINIFLKGRIAEAFREAYPTYSIRIGSIHYNIRENRIGFDSLALTSIDSAVCCTIPSYSVSGIGWLELIWARGLVPHGFTGTVLDAHGIIMDFPQEQYTFRCRLLRMSVPDSEIVVEALEIHPSGADEQFFAGSKFRKTRLRLIVPYVRVMGLACLELLQGKMYRTHSALIQDPFLDVLINKDKPTARDTSTPRMPNEILSSITETIQIDSVNITKGKLNYGERFSIGSTPAVLTFDSLQVGIKGIANHGTAGDTMMIRAQGRFMKSGKLDISMSIPVSTQDFSLRYSGSVSRMDLYKLNPWLEPSDYMRVKSGVLHYAAFDICVATGRAGGNVRAVYSNLSLAALDRHTRREEGIAEIFTSFVANTFKIRGTNVPDKSGSIRIGVVNYVRQREDPFLRFLWFGLRTGVRDVVGF